MATIHGGSEDPVSPDELASLAIQGWRFDPLTATDARRNYRDLKAAIAWAIQTDRGPVGPKSQPARVPAPQECAEQLVAEWVAGDCVRGAQNGCHGLTA